MKRAQAGMYLTLFALVAVTLLILNPMLKLGFIADDVLMSVSAGFAHIQHTNVWGIISENLQYWIHGEGRFFPMPFIYGYLFFVPHPSMLAEKVIQLGAIVLNVVTLFFVIWRVASRRIATIVTLLFVASLQVRSWFDSLIAFFILMPVTSEALLLSFLLWIIALERRSVPLACVGSALGIFALLSYEMTYPIVAVIGLCCWFTPAPRRWKIAATVGTLGPVIALVVVDFTLRAHAHVSSYAITWDGAAYVRTLAEQIVAAIPLSYGVFEQTIGIRGTLRSSHFEAIAAGLLTAVVAYAALRPDVALNRRTIACLVSLGLALWIFPAAIISLSHPLQIRTDHGFGNGYLNVYLETIGFAILAGAFVVLVLQRIDLHPSANRATRAVVALVLGIVVVMTATVDRRNINNYLPIWTDNRIYLDRAFANGLMDAVGTQEAVYWDSTYPIAAWALPALIYQNSHHDIPGPFGDFTKLTPASLCHVPAGRNYCTASTPIWILKDDSDSQPVLIRIDGAGRQADGTITALSDRWYQASPTAITTVNSCLGTPITGAPGDPQDGNASYEGFSGRESLGTDTWHWATASSSIDVTKYTNRPALVTVRMLVQTLGSSLVRISAPGHLLVLHTKPAAEAPVSINLDMSKDQQVRIRIAVSGGIFHAPGDPRELAVRVSQLALRAACP